MVELFGLVYLKLRLKLLVIAQSAEIWSECCGVEFVVVVWDVFFSSCGAGVYGECVIDGEVLEFDGGTVC